MKCSACGRLFATNASLMQHQTASHGGAISRNSGRGRGRGGRRRVMGGGPGLSKPASQLRPKINSDVERGSDILSVAKFSVAKLKDGQVITRVPVSPRAFEGTRLWQVAGLWARWIPIALTLKVSSTCPSTGGGLYGVAWSADPDEQLPTTLVYLARKLGVMPHYREANFWEHSSITVRDPPIQKWLYTDLSQDDSRHGCFMVVVLSPPLGITGDVAFTVQLDWQIAFSSPDVDFPSEISNQYLRADEGYDPFYTTGSKSLENSDRLTLECNTTGGYNSIVRFSQAKADTIYVPVIAGSITYYYTGSDNKTAASSVGALTLMKERSEPFMWCFKSTTEAAAYLKSGTISEILPYVAAGAWCRSGVLLKESKSTLEAPKPNKISLNVRDDQIRKFLAPPGQISVLELAGQMVEIMRHISARLDALPKGTLASPFVVVTPGKRKPISALSAALAPTPTHLDHESEGEEGSFVDLADGDVLSDDE